MNKPLCKLIGEDGNVYAIITKVKRVLHKEVSPEKGNEFVARAMSAESYSQVLSIVDEYVKIE